MTTRERLHELIDLLEPEAAERLIARWDEVRFLAAEWEADDRAPDDAEQARLSESLEDLAAGRTVSSEELRTWYPAPGHGGD